MSRQYGLLQQYTGQLDDQASRLDALKRNTDKTTQQLAKWRDELSAVIGGLSFQIVAAAQ